MACLLLAYKARIAGKPLQENDYNSGVVACQPESVPKTLSF
ncbi:hypothetical protein SAMN04488121_1114 [Chitinophaga filiformis]|uniref:Uncharacterized protein n=1 Tax=Chitinophaga filiformis TaxID=104663 RepID=A0A1G8BD65_CHIFI|nr:hypothetical protein SAMN04488121_1114 [Chitinophaga filiformis]